MKKLLHFLTTVGVLAGLSWVLWIGIRQQQNKPVAKEETETTEETKPEEYVVVLEKKKAVALAIKKEQPKKMEMPACRRAFGSVLDPTALVVLNGELAAAEAALVASQAESERAQALMATNDTPKKIAEASKAQFLADQIKVEGLVRGAQLQWSTIFNSDATKRRAFIDHLVSGSTALIRVDLMPGDALAELPKSARIIVIGREDAPFNATELMPAMAADPKTQAQGFILRVDKPPLTLRPGMALSAWLELPEKPRSGFVVPRSAVLRHDGRTWVYAQEEDEKYIRKPITLDTPLDGNQGWFITESGGLTTDDVIVVVGASSLLSEELKAQGGGAPD
ncbi:MAG: hypothetical protein K8R87_14200 [Verrucomicrobia bacterium]|nr:hypothetical protein [Verrucomicrobiota bacterium]